LPVNKGLDTAIEVSQAFTTLLLSVLVSRVERGFRFLEWPWLRELGNMAYSTYLFHPILLCMVFRVWLGADPRLERAADMLPVGVALAATLGLSWLSWRGLERKLLGVGHRWKYSA